MDGPEYDRLCRKIVDEIPDGIVYADRQGIIRLWNGGAGRMFGHTAEEAVGKSLDLIIPENLRGRHWEGYFRVMESGTTRYGLEPLSVPAIRKDGGRISLEFSIALLREIGAVAGAVAVMRDVTARWKRERETAERLRELEARARESSGKPGLPG